jgi:hypothetical protein
MKAYYDALEKEQQAWRALDGQLPGLSKCSPALWAAWLDAVAQLNAQGARYFMKSHQLGAMPEPPQRRGSHPRNGPVGT